MTRTDAYHRPISYLRVSVTDRCNLRCIYCMPPEGIPLRTHDEILSFEEIEAVVRAAAGLGIHRVRLTGGEPLARLGLADLVRLLAPIPGLDDLSLTTNGTLLARYAADLKQAGLHRVNVSLDTLRPERFAQITRQGVLEDALAGIQAAYDAELTPVKINTVLIRGLNDDEAVDLARKTLSDGWHVRFIEWMPLGGDGCTGPGDSEWARHVVTTAETRSRIEEALGPLEPATMAVGGGPASYYRLPGTARHGTARHGTARRGTDGRGAPGTIGFISPLTEHFCSACNRLRLTADGQLRPCLLSDREIDLRTPLRAGAGPDRIRGILEQAIAGKPSGHHLDECAPGEHARVQDRAMAQIGG
jgi:cyclic pyranopterin phosphate synthase